MSNMNDRIAEDRARHARRVALGRFLAWTIIATAGPALICGMLGVPA